RRGADRQGRDADRPSDIPLRGWRAILLRVKDEIAADHLSVIAAGVAFFTLLALVPGFAALVSIYGMIADPADLERQLAASSGVLPEDAQRIIAEQLHSVVGAANSSLSLAAAISILLSLWSAMSGVKTVFTALNVAYDETEERGFFRLNLIALLFTLGGIVGIIVVLGFIVAVPIALDFIGLGSRAETLISLLRWPVLAVLLLIALGVLYR